MGSDTVVMDKSRRGVGGGEWCGKKDSRQAGPDQRESGGLSLRRRGRGRGRGWKWVVGAEEGGTQAARSASAGQRQREERAVAAQRSVAVAGEGKKRASQRTSGSAGKYR